MRRWSIVVVMVLFPWIASAQTFDELRVSAMGGKSMTNWHGQADIQAMHIEFGRALTRRTTVAVVASPMNVYQPRSWFGDQYGDGGESVRAISATALLRQTFRLDSPLRLYAELSTGPMWAEKRIPAATSHFNMISSAGFGLLLNADSRTPVILGYRFSHISNGGYAPRNPGLNVSSIVLGVQLRTSTRHRR